MTPSDMSWRKRKDLIYNDPVVCSYCHPNVSVKRVEIVAKWNSVVEDNMNAIFVAFSQNKDTSPARLFDDVLGYSAG